MLLRRREVNPDRQDNKGQAHLFVAAQSGHDGVVKMLLWRKDVTPDKPDDLGRTPLKVAFAPCHKRVRELLEPKKAAGPGPKAKRRRHRLTAVL